MMRPRDAQVLSRSAGDAPPVEPASEEEADAWKGRNQGTFVVAALNVTQY